MDRCNRCDVRGVHTQDARQKGMSDQTDMPFRSKVVLGGVMEVTGTQTSERRQICRFPLPGTRQHSGPYGSSNHPSAGRKPMGTASHVWAAVQFPCLVPHRRVKEHPRAPFPALLSIHRLSLLHPHLGPRPPHRRRPAPI